jgi:hypothetical protein
LADSARSTLGFESGVEVVSCIKYGENKKTDFVSVGRGGSRRDPRRAAMAAAERAEWGKGRLNGKL